MVWVKNGKATPHRLTQSSTFHFFGRDRKDVYYLDHNFDDHVRHSCSRCNASVYVKPLKEAFDAAEDIDELVLTRANIFSRLGNLSVIIGCPKELLKKPTERRTLIPAKIIFAGGNAWTWVLEQKVPERIHPNIHQPNSLAKHVRKRMQDINGRDDPFCESIVDILRLIERGDLFSKSIEDSLGGTAGLKLEKERMRC
jgi:hypothetical protein